ncbi:hypothetical protein [Sporosarcina cyprini]|uniref:hypothetical protein n=1 Tax=Sporosarcina cyprini TaxID=2910523 RepID=UPI001EDFAAE5|nr:hypothetical protein [Sporosarcina cyprini]MCG3087533.1 hypothetical protein [Sporosarcina cyprini]
MAFIWSYWRSNRFNGVHPELMAFKSIYWRSPGVNGVQIDLLAFIRSYWRSKRFIGVHPELMAFKSIYCVQLKLIRSSRPHQIKSIKNRQGHTIPADFFIPLCDILHPRK